MPPPKSREEFHNLRLDHNAQVRAFNHNTYFPLAYNTWSGSEKNQIQVSFCYFVCQPDGARKTFAITTANSFIFASFIVLFHLIKSESTMATARHLRFCVSLISGRHVIIYSSVSSFTNSCRVHANFSHPFSAGLDRFSNLHYEGRQEKRFFQRKKNSLA